jgi:uncharacterized membrane protein
MKATIDEGVTVLSADEKKMSPLPPATGSSHINIGTSERIVSAFGGAALAVWGLRSLNSASGVTMFLGGAYLLARGATGYCAVNNLVGRDTHQKSTSALEVKTTMLINKPRSEVYAYWRKLENLPNFMEHLMNVREIDDKKSEWTAEVPGGLGKVSWQAEIQEDISGEIISWCSLPGSTIDNAGEVKFKDATGNKGTEVKATITYRLPAGQLGSLAGKLFNSKVEDMIREDLRRFKRILETGETPVSRAKSSDISSAAAADSTKSSFQEPVMGH